MAMNDKEVIKMLIEDKGQKYLITVDNDDVSVSDKETGDWVYSFTNFGDQLLIDLFKCLGMDSEGA